VNNKHKSLRENLQKRGFISRIVIQAYPGHQVTLDGTVPIEADWELYRDNIFRTVIDAPIWQLFVDDKMMTSARWPNVEVLSEETWSRKGWSRMHATSTLGTMVDDPEWTPGDTLAGQQVSFNGAMAILNLNYWITGVSEVENHNAGQWRFSYDPSGAMQNEEFFQVYDTLYGSFYFIEGSLACLYAPGEWYFNSESRELLLWTPAGGSPAGLEIKGKTQTYAFDFTSSENTHLKGLNFFGTTFRFKYCSHVTVEDCTFLYPSYSKRMMGSHAPIQVSQFLNAGKDSPTYHVVRNCEFAYSDGAALEIWGSGNLIENCLFHDIDYSCHGPWSAGTVSSWYTRDMIFRKNTIRSAGNSETVACGEAGLFEMNDASHCGMLQGDGAIFQFTPKHFDGSIVRFNWVHDTAKRGIRLDDGGKDIYAGINAQIHHNVAWECAYQGLQVKGDQNKLFNNLSFDNHSVDLNVVYDQEELNSSNHTVSLNNIVGKVSRKQSAPDNVLLGLDINNWIATRETGAVSSHLRDIENRDFRPRPGSPFVDAVVGFYSIPKFPFLGKAGDMGPYEMGDKTYWIPGRRLPQTTHPIPADKGISHYEWVDLMWREAYQATSYDIYFGSDNVQVQNADQTSPVFRSNLVSNIFNPGRLSAGETYYWRVDTIREGELVKGDVWCFSAGVNANHSRRSSTVN